MLHKKPTLGLFGLVLLGLLVGGVECARGTDPEPAPATDDTTAPSAEATTPAPLPTRPAMRVYRDPDTGRIGPVPPGVSTPETTESARAASTSGEGLSEEASPVEGGGYVVDLAGRFRSFSEAHLDEEGHLSTDCTTEPSAEVSDDGGEEH